jgi:hypothetical protein
MALCATTTNMVLVVWGVFWVLVVFGRCVGGVGACAMGIYFPEWKRNFLSGNCSGVV